MQSFSCQLILRLILNIDLTYIPKNPKQFQTILTVPLPKSYNTPTYNTPHDSFLIGIQSWIIREREKKSSLGVGLNPAPSMGVALVVCPMVLRVCKKCTAKEIPTLDPSTGNCVAHTPPLHRCSSTLQQPCHCKTMQNCTPAAAGTCKILRSNFFLSIIFRLGFALTPSQYYYSSSS